MIGKLARREGMPLPIQSPSGPGRCYEHPPEPSRPWSKPMTDRDESTPFLPAFLWGNFLERWQRDSANLRPPMGEPWLGPWEVRRAASPGRDPWPWAVVRPHEEDGAIGGRFVDHPTASLIAALLPFRAFPTAYAIRREPAVCGGLPVEVEGRVIGFVYGDGPKQLRRLENALRVVEYLAASPEAVAVALEAIGYAVVVEALDILAGRLDA